MGIGTASPTNLLHVFIATSGATANTASAIVAESNTHTHISIITPNTVTGQILFGDPEDNDVGRVRYDHVANDMQFYTAGVGQVVINSSGNVLIPNDLVHVGDTNTTFGFATDKIILTTGGAISADFSVVNGLRINPSSEDRDFDLRTDSGQYIDIDGGTDAFIINVTSVDSDITTNWNSGVAMFVQGSDGSVGIGTATPGNIRLFVSENENAYTIAVVNDGDNANRKGITITAGADDGSGTTQYYHASDGDGNEVGYTGNVAGTYSVVDSSSRSTKRNIRPTRADGLALVRDLPLFEYQAADGGTSKTLTAVGLIAEDTRDVMPGMVVEMRAETATQEALLGVVMAKLVPVNSLAIQQLANTVEAQRNLIVSLFALIAGLSAGLVKLRGRVRRIEEQLGLTNNVRSR